MAARHRASAASQPPSRHVTTRWQREQRLGSLPVGGRSPPGPGSPRPRLRRGTAVRGTRGMTWHWHRRPCRTAAAAVSAPHTHRGTAAWRHWQWQVEHCRSRLQPSRRCGPDRRGASGGRPSVPLAGPLGSLRGSGWEPSRCLAVTVPSVPRHGKTARVTPTWHQQDSSEATRPATALRLPRAHCQSPWHRHWRRTPTTASGTPSGQVTRGPVRGAAARCMAP